MANPNDLYLTALLQQVRSIVGTTSISAEQQQQIIQVLSEVLQACSMTTQSPLPGHDIQEVRGQNYAKRALEVAAAGGHNILLVGPQGAGKTLLARTLPSLLSRNVSSYPFRAPHSRIDKKAFIGTVKPISLGELTLAHEGVLFLENLPAFGLPPLVALQRAVEEHIVIVMQGKKSIHFPARFILVASIEPCTCGFYGGSENKCIFSSERTTQELQQKQAIIDACFDIRVKVKRIAEDVFSTLPEESSASIRQRIEMAREIQQRRFMEARFRTNTDLSSIDEIQRYCVMDEPGTRLLKVAQQQLNFSARQVLRVLKVARTIADLANTQLIAANHVAEAIQYQMPLK